MTQHRFSSPKVSEREPAYCEDIVFSPTTTTHTPRVCRPGLGLHLNHLTSPVMRRALVFFSDDPDAANNTVGRRLFDSGGWYGAEGPNGEQLFEDMTGS
jgi:hypothetical protein